jgi:hypothetical protein
LLKTTKLKNNPPPASSSPSCTLCNIENSRGPTPSKSRESW